MEILKKFSIEINVIDIINAKSISEIAKLVENSDKNDIAACMVGDSS